MGLIAKIFKSVSRNKSKENPFDLWGKDCWELTRPKDFPNLFRGFIEFLPENSILCFELGIPKGELKDFFLTNSIPERINIPKGTLWPKSQVFHVPATNEILRKLSELAEHYAAFEVAEHFHVYCDGQVLIDWYDAFDDPMYVSKKISENKVAEFCKTLSIKYKNHQENVEQITSPDR
jgi:hypothetical protein